MKRLLKFATLMLLIAAAVSAAPMCTSFGTLNLYLASGFQCQADNFIFSNFAYSGSMTGNPADTVGPPLNPSVASTCTALGGSGTDCYVTPNLVKVLVDQSGLTGALTFLAVWEIAGPDTDPAGGPPPGGPNGPAFETLSLSFDVTPLSTHIATHVLSLNQGSANNPDATLTQSATCNAPCVVIPSNWANSSQSLVVPVATTFHVSNDFRFTSTTDNGDSHLSGITDAFRENSIILKTPEPGTILLGFGGLIAIAVSRKRKP